MRFRFLALLALLIAAAQPARGQFIGFTSPQTVQQNLASSVPCGNALQRFLVQNLGQTQHFATFSTSNSVTQMWVDIVGFDSNGTPVRISETALDANINGGGEFPVLTGAGYFPQVYVEVQCAPSNATFSLSYSGATSTPIPLSGGYQLPTVDKVLFNAQPANANANQLGSSSQTPFGTLNGVLQFQYSTAAVAGSTLVLQCATSSTLQVYSQTFTIANNLFVQTFTPAPVVCPFFNVQYTSGGATAGTFTVDYLFRTPGMGNAPYVYNNITSNTSTQVKTGAGVLHTVTINKLGTGETITLYDSASCAGTTIATITVQTTESFVLYDVGFQTGLCVATAGGTAGDYTVTYQ